VTVDDETLIAFADGELEPARRAEVEAAVQADPAVAERLARHRALRERIRDAYAGVADEPAPDPLVALIAAGGTKPAAEVVDLSARRAQRRAAEAAAGRPEWSWRQAAAMAACLVLGVVVARVFATGDGALLRVDPGGLVARGALDEALSERLASDPAAASPVQVGLSFQARDGAYCRTFRAVARAGTTAGLACREGDLWRVRVTAEAEPEPVADRFRTAASATPAPVTAAVDSLIAGEALDAQGEAQARARRWKPERTGEAPRAQIR
jgi:hypothetical protein